MEDIKYLNQIEDIINEKRKSNPLQQEMDKLFNTMYPSEQFINVFKLGYVYALTGLKNEVSKYMCKDCNECLDTVIKCNREDQVISDYFEKLLK